MSVIAAFVAIALIASWAAAVLPVENSFTTIEDDGRFLMVENKTGLYYAAHAMAIACVMAAGVLSVLAGRLRLLGAVQRFALCVMFAAALLWASHAYTAEEILSPSIFGITGPFVWFSLLLLFAGAELPIWDTIDPIVRALAYVSAGLAFRTLIVRPYGYYHGFSAYLMYAHILMWLGGWTLLTATRMRGWRLAVRFLPLIAFVLMALCSQSRSWVILSVLLGLTFVWLRNRELGLGMRTLVAGCVLAAAAGMVIYAVTPETLDSSVSGIAGRVNDDTRSHQYKSFFAVVPVSDLVLGRGPKGTWYWRGFGEFQFFDNGYLGLLFVGGIPLLFGYTTVLLSPAFRAIRHKPAGWDAAAMCLVLFWALALTGVSTFTAPALSIVSFLVSLCAGRCYWFLAERTQRVADPTVSTPAKLRVWRNGYRNPHAVTTRELVGNGQMIGSPSAGSRRL